MGLSITLEKSKGELLEAIYKCEDEVVIKVALRLIERSNVGVKKYGTTLDENNGDRKYWLNHLLEELLDGANYIQKEMSIST